MDETRQSPVSEAEQTGRENAAGREQRQEWSAPRLTELDVDRTELNPTPSSNPDAAAYT